MTRSGDGSEKRDFTESDLFSAMRNFGWMVARSMYPKEIPVLVDLGPLNDKRSRDCADRLFAAGVSRRNLSIEGNGRLLIRIPTKKVPAVLKRFRFNEGVTYFQCTHYRAALKPGASQ